MTAEPHHLRLDPAAPDLPEGGRGRASADPDRRGLALAALDPAALAPPASDLDGPAAGRGGSRALDLQDVADGLASTLRRPVLINDRAHRPLATSRRDEDARGVQLVDLLRGPGQAAVRNHLDRSGVGDSRQAVRVDLELFGAGERLAVPVRHADGLLATLWLPTGDLPQLTPLDYSSIDAAVSITRDLLGPPGPADDAAGSGTSGLLHGTGAVRRRTFTAMVAGGRLTRGEQTVVWAVDVDSGSPVQRLALGRHFAGTRTPRLHFLADRDGCLLFVSSRRERSAVEEALRGEARRRGIVVLAIGSAHHDRVDDDLAVAAEHALSAAALVCRIPHRPGTADIDELGVWLMLSSVVADHAELARFSRAAHVLWSSGDSTQRETVETYLDVRGQAKDACQRLHVHRTTLYYRLDHLPEVVRDALADGMQRSALHLCLKLVRLWEASGRL